MTKRVMILVYPGCMTLEVAGPADTFVLANEVAKEHSQQDGPPVYDVALIAPTMGNIDTAGSVVTMNIDRTCDDVSDEELSDLDFLLVSGGVSAIDIRTNSAMLAFIRRASGLSKRIGSVCTGAFLLAEAGLLDGRAATTHWRKAKVLDQTFPEIDVKPHKIVCKDGNVWTSGGITSAIDLALAIVEEDLGPEISRAVARLLVTHMSRRGAQSQYEVSEDGSAFPSGTSDPMQDVIYFIRVHPAADLKLEALAKQFNLTEKTLARRFKAFTGKTVGKFVEDVRLAHAQARLENSSEKLVEVANKCGFPSSEAMRRSFTKRFTISPADFRARFRTLTGQYVQTAAE